MKNILAAGAAVAVIGFAGIASAAATPCAVTYPHPAKAKSIKASLIQGFVSCNNPGGNPPNETTEGGTVPTCYPATTYHQAALSPPLGWLWGPKSQGSISFQAAKNKVVHPLNTDPTAADLKIAIKISNILDADGISDADGTSGRVKTLSRATFPDRQGTNGNPSDDLLMTVVDFPVGFGIPVIGGKVNKKTSATAILNSPALNQPALPACSTIELIQVLVNDPNGNTFGALGTFLP